VKHDAYMLSGSQRLGILYR